jgi:hypothetical protein
MPPTTNETLCVAGGCGCVSNYRTALFGGLSPPSRAEPTPTRYIGVRFHSEPQRKHRAPQKPRTENHRLVFALGCARLFRNKQKLPSWGIPDIQDRLAPPSSAREGRSSSRHRQSWIASTHPKPLDHIVCANLSIFIFVR